jgi:glutamine amidotransferase
MQALQEVYPDLKRFSLDARAVVSEPFTDLSDQWEEIPESMAVIIHCGDVERYAFEPRVPD